jgi:ribonuclease HI
VRPRPGRSPRGRGASPTPAKRRRRTPDGAGADTAERLTFGFDDQRPDDAAADDPSAEPERGGGDRTGYVVRTDGAARGNPGPASAGAVLLSLARPDARDPRATPDASISDYLGVQTNNVAEYTAVVRAIGLGLELGARRLELLLDSKLIVEQLAGRWRVKDAKLRPLWAEALRRLRTLPDGWTASHVPRAQNSLADAMCNEAIDRVMAGGPPSVVRRPPA